MTEVEMGTVKFSRMDEATVEDWEIIGRYDEQIMRALPDQLLAAVDALEHTYGFRVTRKEHSLQSATRALADGRSEEYVVAALLHDIGDLLAPFNHGEMMDAVLKPFVSPELCWIVRHHGVFQLHYYGHLTGEDRDARERYRDHHWFDACAEFCERYDQNCFDPEYESLPLEHFEPMVRRVFAEPRYLER